MTNYMLAAQRNDGVRFAATANVSDVNIALTKDVRGMAAAVMEQLMWGLDTYLDPACLCGTKEEKWCQVRHPGEEQKIAEGQSRASLSAV